MEQRPDWTDGAGSAFEDGEIHLRDAWDLLLRNWLIIVLSVIVVLGATIVYTRHMVPVYRAETSIRIAGQGSPETQVVSVFNVGRTQVETEVQVLQSRTLAEDVVDSLHLQIRLVRPRGVARAAVLRSLSVERSAPGGVYVLSRQPDGSYAIAGKKSGTRYGRVSAETPGTVPGATFLLTDGASKYAQIVVAVAGFKGAVAALRGALKVAQPDLRASILTVSYQSADTQLVHEVPNRLAEYFIARGQAIRKTQARSTVAFLTQQIDTVTRSLNEAENALTKFKEGQQVVSLQAEADAQVANLASLEGTRNEVEAEREALQMLVDSVQKQARTADPSAPSPWVRLIAFPTLFKNAAASSLLQDLSNANDQRSLLLQRRTMQDPDVINLTQRIHDIEGELRTTALTYLEGLSSQVAAYDKTLKRFSDQLEAIPAKQVQQARLTRRAAALEDIYNRLESHLQDSRILEAVNDASVRVVDPAILPIGPIAPRRRRNLFMGFILGGMLGVGIALLREYMDETIHTREDLQRATGGAPVLGMIPRIRVGATNGRAAVLGGTGEMAARLVTGRDPRNPVSEAYRGLRTNLTFASLDRPPRTIVFTSPQPQDGKSTSAANLAITLAQQDINALLVDADLRRGVLHTVFGVDRDPGLTTILAGQCEIADAVRDIDLGENGVLHFLPSGPYPPNPAEMLGSKRMKTVVAYLQEHFDLVVMDSPPLTVVTDAAVLGTNADGVILVARAAATEKGALRYSADQLRNVRTPVLGCVLNDVDFRRDGRHYSGYGKYGYHQRDYYAAETGKRKRTEEKREAPTKGT